MEPTAKKLASLPLTEWSALMLCMEHWNYIGESIKPTDSFLHIKYKIAQKLSMRGFQDACACCQFHKTYYPKELCDEIGCIVEWSDTTCEMEYSEFTNFKESPCKRTALAIAYLAEEALERIENVKFL